MSGWRISSGAPLPLCQEPYFTIKQHVRSLSSMRILVRSLKPPSLLWSIGTSCFCFFVFFKKCNNLLLVLFLISINKKRQLDKHMTTEHKGRALMSFLADVIKHLNERERQNGANRLLKQAEKNSQRIFPLYSWKSRQRGSQVILQITNWWRLGSTAGSRYWERLRSSYRQTPLNNASRVQGGKSW